MCKYSHVYIYICKSERGKKHPNVFFTETFFDNCLGNSASTGIVTHTSSE